MTERVEVPDIIDNLGTVMSDKHIVPKGMGHDDQCKLDEFVSEMQGEFMGLLITMSHVVLSACSFKMSMNFGGLSTATAGIWNEPDCEQSFPLRASPCMQSRIASFLFFVDTRFNKLVHSMNSGTGCLYVDLSIGRIGETRIDRTMRLKVLSRHAFALEDGELPSPSLPIPLSATAAIVRSESNESNDDDESSFEDDVPMEVTPGSGEDRHGGSHSQLPHCGCP